MEKAVREAFEGIASPSAERRWAKSNPVILFNAQEKILRLGGNPWVFAGDEEHFQWFAMKADKDAYKSLTREEAAALLGDDWDDSLVHSLSKRKSRFGA